MTSEQRLAQIQERVDKATPGPWWVEPPIKGTLVDGSSYHLDAAVSYGNQGDLSDTFDLYDGYRVDTDNHP